MVIDGDILFQALNDDNILLQHIDDIEAIIKEYSYFQAAWLASTRYLKLKNTFIVPRLQQTAARSIDRSFLFEFVNKERNFEQKILKPEKKAELRDKSLEKPVVAKSSSLDNKQDKKTEEEKKNKPDEPLKIIRPIPRLITKAIPKKPEKPFGTQEKSFIETKEKKEEPSKEKIRHKQDNETAMTKEPEIVVNIDVLNKLKATKKEKENLEPVTGNTETEIKKGEKLSYTEWVQRFKNTKKQKPKNIDLIEKFLKDRPKIVPKKNVSIKPPEIIEQSISEKQMLMTETLANLYVKQKKYEKAIQAFRILSLKYPKKSSYFANQINELKQKLK